jgi:hypothetical protein
MAGFSEQAAVAVGKRSAPVAEDCGGPEGLIGEDRGERCG